MYLKTKRLRQRQAESRELPSTDLLHKSLHQPEWSLTETRGLELNFSLVHVCQGYSSLNLPILFPMELVGNWNQEQSWELIPNTEYDMQALKMVSSLLCQMSTSLQFFCICFFICVISGAVCVCLIIISAPYV